MNKVMLIGRLTSKPELRYTNSNIAVSKFTIAITRTYSNQQGEKETDFINVTTWKKQAENVCNFLDKGSLVAVEGRLQSGSYDDKDGNKRYILDVQADNVQFLESKNSKTESNLIDKNTDPFSDFGNDVVIDDNFLE